MDITELTALTTKGNLQSNNSTQNIANINNTPGTFNAPATLLTQDFYQYEVYNEYIRNINYYLLNSKKSSLVVKYYRQSVKLSDNFENVTEIHNTDRQKETTYTVFEFCPTMDATAINYFIGRNDNRLGYDINSNNTITIFQMEEPLPNDIFYFYSEPNEIFRVTNVQFIQTVHKSLKLYQLTYENAALLKTSIDNPKNFPLDETFYFNNEFDIWFPSEVYSNFTGLIQHKDTLIKIIKRFYNNFECYYTDPILEQYPAHLLKLNWTIHALIKVGKVSLPIILPEKYHYRVDQFDSIISLIKEDIYLPIPDYIKPPAPTIVYVYDPYEGMYEHPLLKAVYELYRLYIPFIEIYLGKSIGSMDTIQNFSVYVKPSGE
jgi:hypothetical protein